MHISRVSTVYGRGEKEVSCRCGDDDGLRRPDINRAVRRARRNFRCYDDGRCATETWRVVGHSPPPSPCFFPFAPSLHNITILLLSLLLYIVYCILYVHIYYIRAIGESSSKRYIAVHFFFSLFISTIVRR